MFMQVKFHGEEAEDAGGVTKEFFMLLLREILDPKYGMFKEYEETRAIWFSEDTFEDEDVYLLIGKSKQLKLMSTVIWNNGNALKIINSAESFLFVFLFQHDCVMYY